MRPIRQADIGAVLELNQHWVPAVGSLTESTLTGLLDVAEFTAAEFTAAEFTATGFVAAGDDGAEADGDGRLAGFVVVLGPGADYGSPNYRYFAQRHGSFTYVDRIAVDPDGRNQGLGRRLYAATAEWAMQAGSPVVCCEVNLEPPNPDSMAFHERMGFTEVGTQWTYDNTVRVRMLECASERVGKL